MPLFLVIDKPATPALTESIRAWSRVEDETRLTFTLRLGFRRKWRDFISGTALIRCKAIVDQGLPEGQTALMQERRPPFPWLLVFHLHSSIN